MGNKVLRYNLRRADRKGGKQTDPWDGPYEVAQVCEKGLYSLIHPSTKVSLRTKVNGYNLKPFFERQTETSALASPSSSVKIVDVQKEEITYKFSPLTVATQRTICSHSGGRLICKKSGPCGKINKT